MRLGYPPDDAVDAASGFSKLCPVDVALVRFWIYKLLLITHLSLHFLLFQIRIEMQTLKFLITLMLAVGCIATPISNKVNTSSPTTQRQLSISEEEIAVFIEMQHLIHAKSLEMIKLLKKHNSSHPPRRRCKSYFWKGTTC